MLLGVYIALHFAMGLFYMKLSYLCQYITLSIMLMGWLIYILSVKKYKGYNG